MAADVEIVTGDTPDSLRRERWQFVLLKGMPASFTLVVDEYTVEERTSTRANAKWRRGERYGRLNPGYLTAHEVPLTDEVRAAAVAALAAKVTVSIATH